MNEEHSIDGDAVIGRLEVEIADGEPPCAILKGELDLATVPIAERELEQSRESAHLVLDLRELRFMDSSGLRLILNLAEGVEPERLTIVKGPDQVNRVFELTGAAERLELVDEPSQAGPS